MYGLGLARLSILEPLLVRLLWYMQLIVLGLQLQGCSQVARSICCAFQNSLKVRPCLEVPLQVPAWKIKLANPCGSADAVRQRAAGADIPGRVQGHW